MAEDFLFGLSFRKPTGFFPSPLAGGTRLLLSSVARRLHPGCHTLLPRCPPVRRYRCTAEVIMAEDFLFGLSFRKPAGLFHDPLVRGILSSCVFWPAGTCPQAHSSFPHWAFQSGEILIRLVDAISRTNLPAHHLHLRSSFFVSNLSQHVPSACLPCARAPLLLPWHTSTRPFARPSQLCLWRLDHPILHTLLGATAPQACPLPAGRRNVVHRARSCWGR